MADRKHCRNCGAPNVLNAKFCANCGAAFVSAAAPPPRAAQSAAPPPRSAQSAPPPRAAPPLAEQIPFGQQPPYSPPPQPRRRFKKRYVLYGFVLLILLGAIAVAMSPQSSTPSQVSAPAPAQSTPEPNAAPSSPQQLTSDQLAMYEAIMTGQGYTVVDHLKYNYTLADGTIVYSGTLSKDGYTTDYQLMVYADAASADAGFAQSVNIVQGMGFDGSYNSATSWTGTSLNGGYPLGAGVVETADNAPYTVAVFFMEAQ